MVWFAPSSKPVTLAPFKGRCQIRSELIHLNRVLARSRCLNDWCEFSARLLRHRPVSCRTSLLIILIAARYERSRSVTIIFGIPCLFIGFFKNLNAALTVSRLRKEGFKDFPFMINGSPQIVGVAIDPDENLIQVPPPLRSILNRTRPPLPNFLRENRAKPIPPSAYNFITDVDNPFVKVC